MFQGPDAAMLISPGHKRGDEVYVSEDVDGGPMGKEAISPLPFM